MSHQPLVLQGQIETTEIRISGKLPGRVDSFLVREGDWVQAGDTLVVINSPTIEAKYRQVNALEQVAQEQNKKIDAGTRRQIIATAGQLWNKTKSDLTLAQTTLTKPFRVAELRARVAAHLRRQNRAPASRMVRGGIGFDLAAKTAMVGEQPLPFTRSEYAISEYLALHAGQTFSKEQIYEAVFGYDGTADDTAVTQHIKNIRAKLRTAGVAAPETVLKTIWGVGYQWKSET